MMISLLVLLATWKCIRREDKLFHSLTFDFQRSLSLVQPAPTKAHPSGRPLTPSGLPSRLVTSGFPKMGCMSTSAHVVGSVLVRPVLTLNQAPTMLFQNEEGCFLIFGATKIQLMSNVCGPFLCIGSWVWLALCLRIYFHGSPPGANLLTSNLARRASACTLGSMIPNLPCDVGRVRVAHFTFVLALVALPPQMKLRITPQIRLHIMGFRFQHAAKYHIDASRTWLAI